jgi:hypothetical protein
MGEGGLTAARHKGHQYIISHLTVNSFMFCACFFDAATANVADDDGRLTGLSRRDGKVSAVHLMVILSLIFAHLLSPLLPTSPTTMGAKGA